MADIRHFAEIDGNTVRLDRVDYRKDGAHGWHAPSAQWVKITRKVTYRRTPSRHECDSRCMFAQGRTMTCECACGGANHGKGAMRLQCQEELF